MSTTLFDQYQRYNNARKIIEGLRINNETFRILEVGANEHRNLEKFLPQDSITYLDIQLPEELLGEPNYILGDATNMGFPDNEYDIVVALDVFEHIPADKREQFIDELHRVSSLICIITAPFHSQQTVDAESRVNTIYKSLFNQNFIWLEEHMENGLPNRDSLINFLNMRKINFKMLGHGKIDIWERLMGIHFFAAKNPILGYYREEIDKFYNTNIFDYDYSNDDCYRMVVVLEKSRRYPLTNSEANEVPLNVLQKLEHLERQFYQLNLLNVTNKNNSERKDKVQLYIDMGQGFSELNSRSFDFKENPIRISVSLQEYQNINSIRIDPSDYSGVYKIEVIKLIGAIDSEIVQYHVNGKFTGPFQELPNVYFFDLDDPNLILSLESSSIIAKLELKVTKLSIDYIVTEIGKLLQKQDDISLSLNEDYNRLMNEFEILQRENIRLKGDIKQLADMNASLNFSKEELSGNLTLILSEKDALAQAYLDKENEKNTVQYKLLSKERELKEIYESRAWKLVVKLRKLLGK